jgi:hypothetical protein
MTARVIATQRHGASRTRHDVVADDGQGYYIWTVPVMGADDEVIGFQA